MNSVYLVDEHHTQKLKRGSAQSYGLLVGDVSRPKAAGVSTESTVKGLIGTARFEWPALDIWFEEDEKVCPPDTRPMCQRRSRRRRLDLPGDAAYRVHPERGPIRFTELMTVLKAVIPKEV